MKIRYIVGSVFVASLVGAILLFSKSDLDQSKYAQKELSSISKLTADDAQQWLAARYIDVETGERVSEEKLRLIQQDIKRLQRNKSISFIPQGPDNIGGRTRAIQIDRTWIERVWAGGVSGGLFVSYNGGDKWTKVVAYTAAGGNPFISSMTQTIDGTLYVATGSNHEGWSGNGVWYSQDFGATWSTVPGTTNCTEIVSSDNDNYVWLATPSGLKKWQVGETSMTNISVTSGPCLDLQISSNGQLVVASMSSNKVYVSVDGGATFESKTGSANNNLVPTTSGRLELAISADVNSSGMYSVYAVRTNSNLLSMHVSHDNGQTWTQFVGASGPPNEFDIYRNQGRYNSVVSVNPTDPENIFIGGIDIWKWNQTVNNPPSGGFEKVSQWFVNPSSSIYVHADNHEMKWDDNNRLYVGNDGGIGISNDFSENWYPANRGFNVTQFYGIAFDRHGAVMGGTQDNGTLYNDHSNSTYEEFVEVGGGDGFECEISYYNPNVMFSSIYYTSISRTGDKGDTWTDFSPDLPGNYDPPGSEGSSYHPFHTEYVLAENYDTNSEDSIMYIPTANSVAGEVIKIPSFSSGDTILYTTPDDYYFDDTLYYDPSLTANGVYFGINPATGETVEMGIDTVIYNVTWDTITVQDPYQSWFLVYINANSGELWGTRNALRLSAQDPNWVCVARGIGGGGFNSIDIEFSKDMEQCYISAGNGIWRVDGLGSVYTSDTLFNEKVSYDIVLGIPTTPTYTTATKITSAGYEGIALNPNNPDDLVLFSGFSGTNKRTANATAAVPSFTNLGSITSPSVGAYDGIIDRDNPNIIVVGTSSGAFVTEDGGSNWTTASAGFKGTPVYEVRQSWRTADEGNGRPGEIYLGTYGRGIWSSAAYLEVDEDLTEQENIFYDMLIYPNPVKAEYTISFDLKETGDVSINVYSLSGVLIKDDQFKNKLSGAQQVKLNASDLPEGTYIIQMVSGDQKLTKKLLKL